MQFPLWKSKTNLYLKVKNTNNSKSLDLLTNDVSHLPPMSALIATAALLGTVCLLLGFGCLKLTQALGNSDTELAKEIGRSLPGPERQFRRQKKQTKRLRKSLSSPSLTPGYNVCKCCQTEPRSENKDLNINSNKDFKSSPTQTDCKFFSV